MTTKTLYEAEGRAWSTEYQEEQVHTAVAQTEDDARSDVLDLLHHMPMTDTGREKITWVKRYEFEFPEKLSEDRYPGEYDLKEILEIVKRFDLVIEKEKVYDRYW